ncbi:MAG: helix-turn-helix transcriptional regulator [Parvibaculum sp.]
MAEKRNRHRLSARVWPSISEALVPETDKRLKEIMDWAADRDESWLFDFLEARSNALQKEGASLPSDRVPPEDYLAQKFGLTVAQAKVLSAFLSGLTLQDIAERQNVKINTVRTHFVQVRIKLGARDQADVVRIALLGKAELEP